MSYAFLQHVIHLELERIQWDRETQDFFPLHHIRRIPECPIQQRNVFRLYRRHVHHEQQRTD